jgi:ABC-2 type transport system permease protein
MSVAVETARERHDPPVERREIHGPSALGGGWRRFWSLLWLQSVTEFKSTYHGTALGYLWSLARPLMLFGILLVVFTQVFRLGSEVPNYPVLLLFNVMLFTFFSEATGQGVTSVVRQENIVRKMQFPRMVIPLSVVMTAAFNLCLNLVAVVIFMVAYGVDPMWTWLLLPVILVALTAFTTGASMLLSALFVRFRDVGIIWTVVSQVLFYGSPILYPIEAAPPQFRDFIQLNPLAPIFELTRKWIIDPEAPGPITAAQGNLLLVVVPTALFVGVCVGGFWYFNRSAPRIAEEL